MQRHVCFVFTQAGTVVVLVESSIVCSFFSCLQNFSHGGVSMGQFTLCWFVMKQIQTYVMYLFITDAILRVENTWNARTC